MRNAELDMTELLTLSLFPLYVTAVQLYQEASAVDSKGNISFGESQAPASTAQARVRVTLFSGTLGS